jgi:hypothetical protein
MQRTIAALLAFMFIAAGAAYISEAVRFESKGGR